jgi:hypothetical protein
VAAGAAFDLVLPDGTRITIDVDCGDADGDSAADDDTDDLSGDPGRASYVWIPAFMGPLLDIVPAGDGIAEIDGIDDLPSVRIAVPAGGRLDLTDPRLRTLLVSDVPVEIVVRRR